MVNPEAPGTGQTRPLDVTALREEAVATNERRFQPSERYRYAILHGEHGEKYFSKQLRGLDPAEDGKWARYLGREPAWAHFADLVARSHPALGLAVLKPVAIEEHDDRVTQVVYPFVDAPFVAEPNDSTPLRDERKRGRYADILLAFDEFGKTWHPDIAVDNSDEHTPFDELDKSWDEWLEVGNLLRDGVLTADMVGAARQLVNDYQGAVHPQMQHGDFTPWHLFDQTDEAGNGPWMTFDGEHASLIKPRFYDLAYSYSRIFTSARDAATATSLLDDFVQRGIERGQFTEDEFLTGFLPVLTTRAMGMFLDAHFYQEKTGESYFAQAHELFARCQRRELGALTQG